MESVARLMPPQLSVILHGLLPDNEMWLPGIRAAFTGIITRRATLSLADIANYSVSSVGELL
jgi:hypothetical protein